MANTWFLGFVGASGSLFSGTGHSGADGFLTFWLIGWTIGGHLANTLHKK